MTYVFKCVDITSFDVHIALHPLQVRESQAVQDACRFLVRSNDYREQYASQKAIETPHFQIRPFSPLELGGSLLWKFFSQTWLQEDQPDYWKLQLPFLCVPHETIGLDMKAAGLPPDAVQVRVAPVVFLSALGWSVHISLRLSGRLESEALINFLNLLRAGNSRPFIIQGGARSLSETHGFLSERLISDVYQDLPGDERAVSRHMVVSVFDFEGPLQLYRRTWRNPADSSEMNAEDRALMHSILYGRRIDAEQAAQQQKTITYTQFTDANFALSAFDNGTLLFMQEMARSDVAAKSRHTLRCLDRNVCRCSMMILMWLHFYRLTSDRTEPKLSTLRGFAPQTLKGLSGRYSNRICQAFFNNDARLQKFASDAHLTPPEVNGAYSPPRPPNAANDPNPRPLP